MPVVEARPQAMLRDWVILNQPHTLKVEVRHHWQHVTDDSSSGRGVGMANLDNRFQSRDYLQKRNDLQRACSDQQQQRDLHRKVIDLKAALKKVGSTNAFTLHTSYEIRRRKQRYSWDAACCRVVREVGPDGLFTYRRTDEGRGFMREMSASWAAAQVSMDGTWRSCAAMGGCRV